MSFDPQRGMGEIRAEDGRIFSVHRTGLDDAAELTPGEAVTFYPDGGRWPRARAVRARRGGGGSRKISRSIRPGRCGRKLLGLSVPVEPAGVTPD